MGNNYNCVTNKNKHKNKHKSKREKYSPINKIDMENLLKELEKSEGQGDRYQIRDKIYNKIYSSEVDCFEEWTKFKNGKPSSPALVRLGIMIAQANTEKRVEGFPKVNLVNGNNAENKANESRGAPYDTKIKIMAGNIFNKSDIWNNKGIAVVIPGTDSPLKILKSGVDCLQGNLLMMTNFMKAEEPKDKWQFPKSYFYNDVIVVKTELANGNYEILKEGHTGKINVLYSVAENNENEENCDSIEKSWGINMRNTLEEMFITARANNIKGLYIPTLGCGFRNLNPQEVAQIYRETFKKYNGMVEEIIIYNKDRRFLDEFLKMTGFTINCSSATQNSNSTNTHNEKGSHNNLSTLENIPIYESVELNNERKK